MLSVASWTTTASLPGMYFSVVSLEKRYKYRFIVSQIVIQDAVLKLYLGTKYKIHFSYLRYVRDTCISDTTQHRERGTYALRRSSSRTVLQTIIADRRSEGPSR